MWMSRKGWGVRCTGGLYSFRWTVGLPNDAIAAGHLPPTEGGTNEVYSAAAAATEVVAIIPGRAGQRGMPADPAE